ncbi:Helicase conserved C-terminal domain/Helicase associated domain (HA2), putative [Angomonas deanei]|uniref:Helicase conserved C-terminal domain/Helicase associated domain (HA2), putative n=1 Tax=Angomonas deanei TaxID=59799 RepID=A0A7G2CNM4_9TRYP|nr:Helicase conserved C-terminal domain/Helicase associated domain (HA2), putative [Angomonas deanei]
MSATIQIETLERYFDGCNGGSPVPIVRIPGTLFPVEEYFLEDVLTWLEKSTDSASDTSESASLYNELKSSVFSNVEPDAEYMIPFEVVVDLIVHIHQEYSRNHSESILVFLPGWAAISRVMKMLQNSSVSRQLSILPLHSSLTTREQQRVFDAPPRGYRKIVLATSIAETSITIDDIVYVIDGGLVKGTSYDPLGNMSSLKASLISKANGTQRRGRAGRCRAGVCVHLLSREVYDALPDFLQPDIVRSPLEEVCLQIKAIRPDERCQHVLSRAMDAPPTTSVKFAVDFLTEMGALTEKEEQLTNLGRALAQLPVHPLLGKMLFAAACLGVLEPVSTIAAGLSVKSVFVRPQVFERDAAQESIQRLDNGDLSDHLCVLKVYEGWVRSGRSVSYAQSHFADSSTLRSLERTKRQLTRYVLQSPLLRRVNNPEQMSSCHRNNTGLIRLVVLWSLYPRVGSFEFDKKRQKPDMFLWSGEFCSDDGLGGIGGAKDAHTLREFPFFCGFSRMYVESRLKLFDVSVVSTVELSLCARMLSSYRLMWCPRCVLEPPDECYAAPKPVDYGRLGNWEDYRVVFVDGDKKLYVAERRVAVAIQMARECMDYYLALCIKKLRADAFPIELVRALAMLIGDPLQEGDNVVTDAYVDDGVDDDDEPMAGRNMPSFVRGAISESSDSDGDGPVVLDDPNEMPTLELTEEQRRKVVSAFGDLALFRRDGANFLLDAATKSDPLPTDPTPEAAPTQPTPADNGDADDDEEDEDVIVAPVGKW